MFGRILISLISCVFWLLRARLAFFCASYLCLPTSRNLHTGGSALGETSTRLSPSSCACSIASRVYITPRFSPASSITRTLGTLMNSSNRGPLRGMGGAPSGRRIIGGRITASPVCSLNGGDIVIRGPERKTDSTPPDEDHHASRQA